MGKIIRNTLILTIITVVAGLGLGLVYEVTKEPIARTEEQAKKEAWQTVFSDVSLEDFKAVDVDKEAADKTAADLGIKATVDEVCEAADEGVRSGPSGFCKASRYHSWVESFRSGFTDCLPSLISFRPLLPMIPRFRISLRPSKIVLN